MYNVGIAINNADGDSGVALGTTTANDEDSGAAAGWTIHDISFWHDSGVWNANAYKYRIAVNATPNNTPATGLSTITGTAQVGQTLTAATTGIADTDGKTKAENGDTGYADTYQWVRVDGSNETDITGAASKTYIPAAADVGKTIKVQVSFTDDASNPESLTSDPAGPVAQTVPIGIEANYPSIGAGIEDLVFTLTRTGAVKDELERTVSIVQAQKWLGASDLSRTVTIARSDEVRARAPATGKPSIRGTAWVGGTLRVVTTDITDEDGLSGATYGYQWVRVDADGMSNATDITSETSVTYVPVEADVGKKVRVKVSFTDDGGSNEELTSDAYPSSGTIEAEAPGICERTRQVRLRILDRIPNVSDCALVTDARLANITGTLDLSGRSIAALAAGDFAGLPALTTLRLDGNELATLPDDVFEPLPALTDLRLAGNSGASFAPVADALPDDGTVSNGGGTVTLDGSGSDGGPWGTNVTYGWALTAPTSGVTVRFDDDASVTTLVTIEALAAGFGQHGKLPVITRCYASA